MTAIATELSRLEVALVAIVLTLIAREGLGYLLDWFISRPRQVKPSWRSYHEHCSDCTVERSPAAPEARPMRVVAGGAA